MKIRLGDLRTLIKEHVDCWAGSKPDEMYEQELADDPALKKRSVLVPDDVKDKIGKWMRAMGLSGKKKR